MLVEPYYMVIMFIKGLSN